MKNKKKEELRELVERLMEADVHYRKKEFEIFFEAVYIVYSIEGSLNYKISDVYEEAGKEHNVTVTIAERRIRTIVKKYCEINEVRLTSKGCIEKIIIGIKEINSNGELIQLQPECDWIRNSAQNLLIEKNANAYSKPFSYVVEILYELQKRDYEGIRYLDGIYLSIAKKLDVKRDTLDVSAVRVQEQILKNNNGKIVINGEIYTKRLTSKKFILGLYKEFKTKLIY